MGIDELLQAAGDDDRINTKNLITSGQLYVIL